MSEENKKIEYITKEYFDESLDKRFAENNQVLLGAIDSMMAKRLEKTEGELRKEIYIVRDELKTEISETREDLKYDTNN